MYYSTGSSVLCSLWQTKVFDTELAQKTIVSAVASLNNTSATEQWTLFASLEIDLVGTTLSCKNELIGH